MNEIVKLHPKGYREMHTRMVFYFNESRVSENQFRRIFQEMQTAKTYVVTSYPRKDSQERGYTLYVGPCVMNFFGSDYQNLQVARIFDPKEAKTRKSNLYKQRIFTIIPACGVTAIYNKSVYPENADTSWKMDHDEFYGLLNGMDAYFDMEEDGEDEEKSVKITERFRRTIIRPFREYTAKEHWVEQYKQTQSEGVSYFKREYARKNNLGPVYRFYSNDENADPERGFFNLGDRINIIDTAVGDKAPFTGVLEAIDDESDENAVILEVAFYHQADDVVFPKEGKMVLSINDTQNRVRSRVIHSLEGGNVESKYMYQVFDNFSVGGYEEVPDDLKDYLIEKMAGEYPPNQMQLEAIIKGILTEDLLLVLGPPGTGKTTVISFWVEYFIRQGKRVLISSQNNAAVDNVLARFGKMAETVRLGNEQKVQENCKPYLPQNKIASMQEHFNLNYARVSADIIHNESEMKEYKKRLSTYRKLYEQFYSARDVLSGHREIIGATAEVIRNKYREIEHLEGVIQEGLVNKAKGEIFLRVYNSKGVFHRFFNRRIAERMKKQVECAVGDLEINQKLYKETICEYNVATKQLEEAITVARDRNVVEHYYFVLGELVEYTRRAARKDFLPQLVGEVQSRYHPTPFVDDYYDNWQTIDLETREIERVERIFCKMKKAIEQWMYVVNTQRNDIMQNALIQTCQIVGATCIGINSSREFANVDFDVSIVDESGQIQIHNALIPMSRARKNLLLGDYKQIPPCANEDVVAACKADEVDISLLNMSFFEFLFEKMRKKTIDELEKKGLGRSEILKPVLADYIPQPYKRYETKAVKQMIGQVIGDSKKLVNLNNQFRMPGNISDIISKWFYEGNYYSSYNMNRFAPMLPGTEKPLVVISTSNGVAKYESQPPSKMGYQNHYEAQLIVDVVSRVIEAQPKESRVKFIEKIEDNIGIISAYGAQVRLIREYIAKESLGLKPTQIRGMVASLDSFQGQERPLIIYSLTRSTSYKEATAGRVGFMKELRRLNVAFTRCQKQLVVIGDIDYLSECMHMGQVSEESGEWPCMGMDEKRWVTQEYIEQCAECPAVCERKFARFMRLMMQHVEGGAGERIESEDYLVRDA